MNLKKDTIAGVSVFFVAIPLCLGIAQAVHVSLLAGLVAGIIGGIIVGSLSKSPLSVSGPAAGLISIILSVIGKIGITGLFLAVLLGGIMQILLGVCKASKVSKYIPSSVIQGMLAGIGLTLIIKQTPILLGLSSRKTFVRQTPLAAASTQSVIIAILALVVRAIWIYSKHARRIPMGIAMVIITGIIAAVLGLQDIYKIHIPTDMTLAVLWPWNDTQVIVALLKNYNTWIAAVTIALVASIETILSIHAIDHMDEKKRVTPMNRELVAQGVGNMISGLLGGLPITSVIIRSTVNHHAGAQSKYSTIFHGLLIAITLCTIPFLINYIPAAGLAVILIATGYKLCSPKHVYHQYRNHHYSHRLTFFITWILVVTTDLLSGVAIGCVVYYVIQSTCFKKIIQTILPHHIHHHEHNPVISEAHHH